MNREATNREENPKLGPAYENFATLFDRKVVADQVLVDEPPFKIVSTNERDRPFVWLLEDGRPVALAVGAVGDGVIEEHETYVPPKERGRGAMYRLYTMLIDAGWTLLSDHRSHSPGMRVVWRRLADEGHLYEAKASPKGVFWKYTPRDRRVLSRAPIGLGDKPIDSPEVEQHLGEGVVLVATRISSPEKLQSLLAGQARSDLGAAGDRAEALRLWADRSSPVSLGTTPLGQVEVSFGSPKKETDRDVLWLTDGETPLAALLGQVGERTWKVEKTIGPRTALAELFAALLRSGRSAVERAGAATPESRGAWTALIGRGEAFAFGARTADASRVPTEEHVQEMPLSRAVAADFDRPGTVLVASAGGREDVRAALERDVQQGYHEPYDALVAKGSRASGQKSLAAQGKKAVAGRRRNPVKTPEDLAREIYQKVPDGTVDELAAAVEQIGSGAEDVRTGDVVDALYELAEEHGKQTFEPGWVGLEGFVRGEPALLYHGTTASFDVFDRARARRELVDQYYGDGMTFTPRKDIAWQYAYAARNAFLPRSLIADLEQANPHAGAYLRLLVERGPEAAWNAISPEGLGYDTDAPSWESGGREAWQAKQAELLGGLDMNLLGDIAKHIEGSLSEVPPGEDDEALASLFGHVPSLPSYVFRDIAAAGLSPARYRPKVVTARVRPGRVLVTGSSRQARRAEADGYDSVLFHGRKLVGGVAEVAVFDPRRIEIVNVEVEDDESE